VRALAGIYRYGAAADESADPIQAIIFAIVHVEYNDLVYQGCSDLLFHACDS
jgi:hypothetical protein